MNDQSNLNAARESLGGWAVCIHAFNPLQIRSKDAKKIMPGGKTIKDLAPSTPLPFICILNGRPLMRKDWFRPVSSGDIITFQVLPQGGGGGGGGSDTLRTILTIVLIVVINIYAPGAGAAIGSALGGGATATAIGTAIFTAAAMAVGNAVINAVAPLPSQQTAATNTGVTPSSVYNAQLQGNQARLYNPIPVGYGYNNMFPDFACQPYYRYEDHNQFFYALYCVGQGYYTPPLMRIDDTDISVFGSVPGTLEIIVLQPGDVLTQTLVFTNVVNATEVSNQELTPNNYVGPFTACGAKQRITKLEIDIIFPSGLLEADSSGNYGPYSVNWVVEARRIDDRDNPINAWTVIGSHVYGDSTPTARRLTYEYTLTPGRYQVQLKRTSPKTLSNRVAEVILWGGMKAFLQESAINCTTATFIALKIKSSEQLSGQSQRKFNVITTRMLPIWNGTTWSAPQETRSIAWAFADILRNTVYGEGRPDSRIDLDGLMALDTLYIDRGDYFDGIFESVQTQWQALQSVARAGRGVPLIRMSVISMVRDSQQTLPVAMYTTSNIIKNSLNLSYQMFTEESIDGIQLEYWDNVKFNWVTVLIPSPGVVAPEKWVSMRIFGVTSLKQATREGKYIVANDAFRRKFIKFGAEMDGLIPAYGDLIAISHDMPGWGTSGEVTEWDEPTNLITLTEDLEWEDGATHYMSLQIPTGGVIGPYEVIPGPETNQAILLEEPSSLPYTGAGKDRTRFIFGAGTSYQLLARVVGIKPRSTDKVDIEAVVEDNRVHTYDGGSTGGGGVIGSRLAYFVAFDTPVYTLATGGQKAHGAWFANSLGTVDDEEPYVFQAG